MTTFTVTTSVNYESLTSKQGGDLYNVNSGTFIIDSDSRYGINTSVGTGAIGNITISSTLGGRVSILGNNTRLIKFDTALGTVPIAGTAITQGAVSSELVCVMSTRVGGIIYSSGTLMPATGYIKVRNKTGGSYAAGSLSGIFANCVQADEIGWIEIVGVESSTLTIPRLGELKVEGEWFYVGTTTGIAGQTIQLPAFDSITEYPGIEIETLVGSNEYDFWPNAGNKFVGSGVSTDSRGKLVGISTGGLVTIGMGRDSLVAGMLPTGGRRIRIPNIIFSNCTILNKSINATPNSIMGTRYEFATNSAGVININRCTGSWYLNFQQPYSLELNNVHTCEQVVMSEVVCAPVINNLHVGMSNQSASFSGTSIIIQQCYNGGTINTISALRPDSVSATSYPMYFTNLYGGWIVNNIRSGFASNLAVISGSLMVYVCEDMVFNDVELVGKRFILNTGQNITLNRIVYADQPYGTTTTSSPCHAVETSGTNYNIVINNISNWPDAPNVHPYSGIVYFNSTLESSVLNIGTAGTPFNCGTLNATGYIVSDGGNNSRCKFQRNWCSNLRLGTVSSTNTSFNITCQNNYNVDASKTSGPNSNNTISRGNRHNSGAVPTSYTSVYGTSFWDAFTGDTTTKAVLVFNEKTSVTSNHYIVDSGYPKFTSQGSVVMQAVGDQITWTWPYKILGWTGLSTTAVTGTNTANHLMEYDLDTGSGFSGVFKTLTSANLALETALISFGFTLKIRIKCITASVTNVLTSVSILGTTTLSLQNSALYPMDTVNLVLNSIQTGSTIGIFVGIPEEGQPPIVTSTSNSSSISIQYTYEPNVIGYTVRIRKPGYKPLDLYYGNTLNVTIPVSQQIIRDGYGVDIYGRGSGATSAYLTILPLVKRIDIGNIRCTAEDLYNKICMWQVSAIGMNYAEVLTFDGTDILVFGDWRFRRAASSDINAGIDAVPTVHGSLELSPDDEVNGSIDFRARTVRTYETSTETTSTGTSFTAAELAAAVWSYVHTNGSTAESNLVNSLNSAQNAFAASV